MVFLQQAVLMSAEAELQGQDRSVLPSICLLLRWPLDQQLHLALSRSCWCSAQVLSSLDVNAAFKITQLGFVSCSCMNISHGFCA